MYQIVHIAPEYNIPVVNKSVNLITDINFDTTEDDDMFDQSESDIMVWCFIFDTICKFI